MLLSLDATLMWVKWRLSFNSLKHLCLMCMWYLMFVTWSNWWEISLVISKPFNYRVMGSWSRSNGASLRDLNALQEMLGFSFANKLKKKHITWQQAQDACQLSYATLSNSVADAIDFLHDELAHSKFQGSEATTEFIRKIDAMFDIFNSKNPFLKGTEGPVTLTTFHVGGKHVMKHALTCWASGMF